MALLVTGMIFLIGIHLLPTFTDLRQYLVKRLGIQIYQGIFSLISLAGLILIVVGMSRAEFHPLWQPPAWSNNLTFLVMLPALVLPVAAYLPSNIKRFTPHPMLWGVVLWSAGHLLANGDLASLVLFGGFGIYALFDMASANWRGAAKQTYSVAIGHDFLVIVIGLVAYVVLVNLHPQLFGTAIIWNA